MVGSVSTSDGKIDSNRFVLANRIGSFRFGAIAYTVFSWRTKHAVLIEAKTKQLKQHVAYLQCNQYLVTDTVAILPESLYYTLQGQM